MTRLGRWLSPGVRFDESRATWMCRTCGYPWIDPPRARPEGRSAPPNAPPEFRCPECGSAVDPATRRGLRWSLPGAFAQWLMRAPSVPMLVAGLAAACGLFYARTVPVGLFGHELFSFAALGGLIILYAAGAVVAAILATRRGRLRDAARQRGWWFVPLAWAVAAAIAFTPAPIEAGFLVHRGALDAFVATWKSGDIEALRAGGPAGGAYDRLGAGRMHVLFDGDRPMRPLDVCHGRLRGAVPLAEHSDPKWDGLVVAIPGTGFLFELGGYVYLPDLPPGDMPPGTLSPLGDGWWQGMVWQD